MPSYLTSIVLQWSSDSLTESRITNPTFDAGITSWTEADGGAASLTPTHDTTVMRSGAGSLKLVNTAGGEDDYMQATFTGVSGVTYQVRAWVNVTVFTSGAVANLGLRAADPTFAAFQDSTITAATSGWVQKTVQFTALSSGTCFVRLYAPQGTTYWDDVSVVGWTTVDNNEIQSLEWWAGIDREGNDPEPGGMTVTLKNKSRKWEPLFGSNLIDTQQRFRLTLNGTQEGVWYTETFDLDYPTGQEFSWVTITCGDSISVLALDDLPSLDPPDADTYQDVVGFDEPLAYYSLDDPKGTQVVPVIRRLKRGRRKGKKVRRGERVARTEATAQAGNAGIFNDASGLSFWQEQSLILGDAGFSYDPGSGAYATASVERTSFYEKNAFTIEAWIRWGDSGVVCGGPWQTADARHIFYLTQGGLFFDTGATWQTLSRVTGSPATDTIVHIVGTWDGQTSCLYHDGVLEATESDGGHLDQGDANEFLYIHGSELATSFTKNVDEVAFYEHALSAERVLAHYQAGALRGFPQQTAGERIAEIATSPLWSEAGIQTTGRDVVPIMQHGQGRMEEIAEAAHAEGPRTMFFFNGNGDPVYLGFEWQDTNANYNTVQWTFTDDGTGRPYQDVQLEYDFETFNEVLASHESGESVTVTDTTESGKRGRRVNSEYTDVLLVEHHDVEALAAGVLDYYKEPAKRPVSLTIDGHHSLAQILDLDIGHLIKVTKQGETGAATERVCHIIAKRKSIDTSKHLTCTYTLSRGFDPTVDVWYLGYAGFTELGSTTVLG